MTLGTLTAGMRRPYSDYRYDRDRPPLILWASTAALLFVLVLILWIWKEELLW